MGQLYFWENRLKFNLFVQRMFFRKKISWEFPLSLNIETTNNCNFDCSICPRKKGNRGFGNMDFGLYKRIIEQIKRGGRRLYILTLIKDGEPLLHPRLAEMISLAKEKKVAHRVEIFTNGSLLDEKKGKILIKAGLDVLQVSLNAAHPQTHQKITGTKTFTEVVRNLENFLLLKKEMRAANPLVVVKMVATKEMGDKEKREFKKQWQGKADQAIITPLHNYAGGFLQKSLKLNQRWPCLVLWFNPVINFNGEVTTCCVNYQRNELIMGDIKKQTLNEIWQNERYRQLRKDHLKRNFKNWPTCASCNYWRIFVNLDKWLAEKEKQLNLR